MTTGFRVRLSVCSACVLLVACNNSTVPPPATSTAEVTTAPIDTAPEWSLDKSDSEYLWELEHYSNVLVKHGFGRLASALKKNDSEALQAVFADQIPSTTAWNPTETTISNDVLAAVRNQAPEGQVAPMTRGSLIAFLSDERGHFPEEPKIRFDVKTISPLIREDLAGEWTALCVMRMWGDRGDEQPSELSVIFDARFDSPTKERMAEPGWLRGFSIKQVATSAASRFLFREAAEEYNIDVSKLADNWTSEHQAQNSGGIFACDYNRDGCVDLLVTDTNTDGNFLLRGKPQGGFDDVTADAGLATLGRMSLLDASFADLDNDGWEDLVFARGIVFKNVGGKKFESVPNTNIAKLCGGFSPAMEANEFTVTTADFDRDGLLDLYIIRNGGRPTSWLEDTLEEPVDNLLLRNLGNWQFEDVTEQSGTSAAALSAFTALWLDVNNDLWPDLYVISEYGDGLLHVNEQNGSFRVIDADESTADFGSMGATCGDIDNDGNIDIYIGSMYSKAGSRVIGNMPIGIYPDDVMFKLRRLISGSEFYQNEGDLSFKAAGESYQVHDVGWSWGPTMADFDNDGFLDIFATAGYISRDRGKPDG